MSNNNRMREMSTHLLKAYIDWFIANDARPHIAVKAQDNDDPFIRGLADKAGLVVLNVAPSAVVNYSLDDTGISFTARFQGVSRDIFIPIDSIELIFSPDLEGLESHGPTILFGDVYRDTMALEVDVPSSTAPPAPEKKAPHLKVVK